MNVESLSTSLKVCLSILIHAISIISSCFTSSHVVSRSKTINIKKSLIFFAKYYTAYIIYKIDDNYIYNSMKKVFFILILSVLLLIANKVDALTYKNASFQEANTYVLSDSTLSEAKLLQKYVQRYQEKINNLYSSFSEEQSQIMKDANTILDKMASTLSNIQNRSLSENKSAEVMKSIVEDLKFLNERMKTYLDQEMIFFEEELANKKKQFLSIGQKISVVLESLIERFTSVLIKKEELNKNEKEIVESLVKIRTENNKIKNFENIRFSSIEEMESYFKGIIKNIRNEILVIKELSR